MSDTTGGPLVRRVLNEYRRVIVPLVAALVLNLLAYAFVVLPLSQRVANVAERTEAAENALAAARREHAQAAGTLTGKDQAAKELTTFYTSVLPADLAGARRLTHLRLAQLAAESDLRYGRASTDVQRQNDSTLNEFRINLDLAGSYDGVRSFIHRVETSPEFVIIKHLELAEEGSESGLRVRLELSTYFRDMEQQ